MPMPPRHVHHLGDAPAAEVGHAPVADLAGAQQVVQRAQRLFQVHAVEVAVQVQDVDVVGLQARRLASTSRSIQVRE
jgi:hypothetical protein